MSNPEDIKDIIKYLKERISWMEKYEEDMDEAGWHSEDGLLLTGNQAKIILKNIIK